MRKAESRLLWDCNNSFILPSNNDFLSSLECFSSGSITKWAWKEVGRSCWGFQDIHSIVIMWSFGLYWIELLLFIPLQFVSWFYLSVIWFDRFPFSQHHRLFDFLCHLMFSFHLESPRQRINPNLFHIYLLLFTITIPVSHDEKRSSECQFHGRTNNKVRKSNDNIIINAWLMRMTKNKSS